LFAATIQRSETADCEANGYKSAYCPSGDERGIYAANLVLDRTASEFVRPTAHFAVIFLSDEDERGLSDERAAAKNSDGTTDSGDLQLLSMYPLENYDLPSTFVTNFKTRYPDKTMSAHSIIVKPGDTTCRDLQTGQGNNVNIRGVEGYSYYTLSQLTGGKIGTICADDYGSQLQNIGYQLQDSVTSIPLKCTPLEKPVIQYSPQPATAITANVDYSKMVITFDSEIPASTKVTVSYDCAAE
jgi:hypothetical protein